MDQRGELFSSRIATIGLALALAMLARSVAFAQQKPIVIELDASAAAASSKALTVLSKPGSYILTRNIVDGKSGFDALAVTASNVTIDLQGFVIMATTSGTGNGINATGQSNVVIRNGIITGFGGAAIVLGNNGSASAITANANGSGITCGIGCLISGNVIQGNTGLGLSFSDPTSGYVGNILQGNDGSTVGPANQVSGGTSLNQNLCNGVAC